jgi:hypothetical protein
MSTTDEIARVCAALPPEKQAEVADFARFLLSREDDAAWEQILSETEPRPRFQGFLRQKLMSPLIRENCEVQGSAKLLACLRRA